MRKIYLDIIYIVKFVSNIPRHVHKRLFFGIAKIEHRRPWPICSLFQYSLDCFGIVVKIAI